MSRYIGFRLKDKDVEEWLHNKPITTTMTEALKELRKKDLNNEKPKPIVIKA